MWQVYRLSITLLFILPALLQWLYEVHPRHGCWDSLSILLNSLLSRIDTNIAQQSYHALLLKAIITCNYQEFMEE